MDARSIRFKKESLCVNALETLRTQGALSWRLCEVKTSAFLTFSCSGTRLPSALLAYYHPQENAPLTVIRQECIWNTQFSKAPQNGLYTSLRFLDTPACYRALEQAFTEDAAGSLSRKCYHPSQWNGGLAEGLLCFGSLPQELAYFDSKEAKNRAFAYAIAHACTIEPSSTNRVVFFKNQPVCHELLADWLRFEKSQTTTDFPCHLSAFSENPSDPLVLQCQEILSSEMVSWLLPPVDKKMNFPKDTSPLQECQHIGVVTKTTMDFQNQPSCKQALLRMWSTDPTWQTQACQVHIHPKTEEILQLTCASGLPNSLATFQTKKALDNAYVQGMVLLCERTGAMSTQRIRFAETPLCYDLVNTILRNDWEPFRKGRCDIVRDPSAPDKTINLSCRSNLPKTLRDHYQNQ